MTTAATDYEFPVAMAESLTAVACLPAKGRYQAIQTLEAEHGVNTVRWAFAHFIGLANSVVDNAREMAELLLITEGGVDFRTAEKINMPTILGALAGVGLAQCADTAAACSGCAFKIGTAANQSPITTLDAGDCAEAYGDRFMCHEDLDDQGQPTKPCAGWAKLVATLRRQERAND